MPNFRSSVPGLFFCTFWLVSTVACAAPSGVPVAESSPHPGPSNRAASIFVAQDFVNQQIALHSTSELIQNLNVELDPKHDQILIHGILNIPLEEMRAINIDPKLGKFKFQLAVHLSTTTRGHIILEFPLNETFFYPADSKNPKQDRVVVPVQMLSLALASARGYLAALSGDFNGFDRRTAKLEALMKALDHEIEHEKNQDALDDLRTQREALRLQVEAIPIERKQLTAVAKEVATILGFTGEKELNLNDDLAAKKNALVLKINLDQLVPYLKGVELGGIRILHDKKDGGGENYLVVDVNMDLAGAVPPADIAKPSPRSGMKAPPALIMRLNQALFESDVVLATEKKDMGSNLRDFGMQFKDDGLHVSGKWHELLFSIPFDTIVDFVATGTDIFEVRVRELKVAGLDFSFLTKFVLEAMKKRLDQSLKGMCTFSYVGEEKDHSRALQVKINPKQLVPAFSDLHLVDVDVRDREFLLKIGKPSGGNHQADNR